MDTQLSDFYQSELDLAKKVFLEVP